MRQKNLIVLSFFFGVLVSTAGYYFFKAPCQRFPHVPEKHKYQALLTPQKHLERIKAKGKYPKHAPPKTLIVCADNLLLKTVLQKYRTEQCDGYFSPVYFFVDYPSVAIAHLGMTAPHVAIRLEMTIAWGVKNIIFIGTCCGLQENIAIGDLIVCERSIRDEGTSYHYLVPSKYVYASRKIKNKLIKFLKKNNVTYKLGTIVTTDGFYRTTQEEVDVYQKEGVLAVEMETAGLLSVATFNNIDMIALLTITDSYAKKSWEKPLDYKEQKIKALASFVKIALDFAG